MSLKSCLHTAYQYTKDQMHQSGDPVRFYNWIGDTKDNWFRKFINSRKIPCSHNKTIAFFSVFGDKFPTIIDKSRIKVFYTGENMHRNEFGFSFQDYADYLQNKNFDLSLAFDYIQSESYLRLPLWVLYFINPDDTSESAIKKACEKLSNHGAENIDSKRFCSMVSGHDPNGLREKIYDSLVGIDEISCGGRFLNNTDELKRIFDNDKIRYLEQFRFNICPENSNSSGYVTEKIMECISSGSIPVYWGSDNNPEPDILNKDAIIFWDRGGDNAKNVEFIRTLHENPQLYKEFYSQARLKPEAAAIISEMLRGLENRLRTLIARCY